MTATPSCPDTPPPAPLGQAIPDPSGREPMCDEPTFAAILEGMVADEAPRLFAVVQEYGERVDARIAGWGMAFEDHAEVISVEGGIQANLDEPEGALSLFNRGSRIHARLVWFNPDAATLLGGDEEDELAEVELMPARDRQTA
ncbi:MAG TPA: hypothetical protein VF444_24745 [Pseudonocardiaceae bacterium]